MADHVFDKSKTYDLKNLLSAAALRLLARQVALLQFIGGWGEVHLVFKGGDLVEAKIIGGSLTRDEPPAGSTGD